MNAFLFQLGRLDICGQIDPANIKDFGPYNLTLTAYEELYSYCVTYYNETVVPAFNEFGKCDLQRLYPKGHPLDRIRRFVLPLAAVAVSLGLIGVGTNIAGAVILYKHNVRITHLETIASEMETQLNSLRADLFNAKNSRDALFRETNSTAVMAFENKKAILFSGKLTPRIAWDSGMIQRRIVDAAVSYQILADECRNGKVDVRALKTFLNGKAFDGLTTDHARLRHVKRVNGTHIGLSFSHPVKSLDTGIFRSVAMDHWRNVGRY